MRALAGVSAAVLLLSPHINILLAVYIGCDGPIATAV